MLRARRGPSANSRSDRDIAIPHRHIHRALRDGLSLEPSWCRLRGYLVRDPFGGLGELPNCARVDKERSAHEQNQQLDSLHALNHAPVQEFTQNGSEAHDLRQPVLSNQRAMSSFGIRCLVGRPCGQ